MPAITLHMTEYAYSQSVLVFQGNSTRLEAVERIVTQSGMNEGSAKDYVVGVGKILSGDLYKRTFNTEATDYILTKISQQFASNAYEKALISVELHINYYENLRHGKLNSIRDVLNRHRAILSLNSANNFPDEIDINVNLTEGVKKSISVNAYERNTAARNKCIAHYGPVCNVCNFKFEAFYGDVGAGFIHVHHIVPLHTIGKSYVVDPIKDLRPVCPNCHAMLHRGKTILTITDLKEIITSRMSMLNANKGYKD